MTSPVPAQPNNKRYWGEEKNIDSIYAIYLKKISYTYNNDASALSNQQVDNIINNNNKSKASSNYDLTKFAIQNSAASQSNKQQRGGNKSGLDLAADTFDSEYAINCQKAEETPRSRKNFFQKYRRRSCSMDKYSFEKNQRHQNTSYKNMPPAPLNETTATTTTISTPAKQTKFFPLSNTTSKKNKLKHNRDTQIQLEFNDRCAIDTVENNLDELDAGNNGVHRNALTNSTTSSTTTSSTATSNSVHTTKHTNASHRLRHHYTSSHELSTQVGAQSLQWETRQIKVLQAATFDHALKFILLINSARGYCNNGDAAEAIDTSALEEERNNVAHTIHVLFCTYRIYTNPYELMLKIMDYSDLCRMEQYRFVMHYWMDNYPEDFDYLIDASESSQQTTLSSSDDKSAGFATPASAGGGGGAATTAATPSIVDSSFNNSNASYTSTSDNGQESLASGKPVARNQHAHTNSLASSRNSQCGSDQLDRRLSNLSLTKTSDELTSISSSSVTGGGGGGGGTNRPGVPLVSELMRLCRDEYIWSKAARLSEMRAVSASDSASYDNTANGFATASRRGVRHNSSQLSMNSSSVASSTPISTGSGGGSSSSSRGGHSAILDLDSRYVAQQLTAIDLDNFLSIKPYALLEGTRSDKRVQSMIKNFNLLSRHVVVTTLKSHNPHLVASHWIAIAQNLRKIKNFNSLKAIIAGLTNESIYRLKQVIWNKLDRASLSSFKTMASIVDDVNNQTVLRQTQLVVEGTAKMSIEDDSFGTIPYLGTFLTDLNMIDARYPSYVPSPKDETSKLKLINFEKCSKQFEILTQVQLLQKNVLASLHALQRRNLFDEQTTLNRLKAMDFSQNHQMLLAKPAIPQPSRLFENWFYDPNVASMTDKQCYEISVGLEQNASGK